jgi:CHASE2 domain-containing sensor protein
LTLVDSGSELGKALYCLINIGLMGIAVLLRRPVFMVFGALGVAAYLGYLSYEVFAESLLFPVVVTVIGLGVIWLGLVYQKRRERLSQAFRNGLPQWLRVALPALRD